MENERKPYNPYDYMDEEELYGVVRDLQMYQRQLTREYELVQLAILERHRKSFET